MPGGLPVTIDPVVLADKGARLKGWVAIRGMARLRALLLDDSGEAEVELVFERAEGSGLRRMRGRVATQVRATCQRCLEPMSLSLRAAPDVMLLEQGEQEAQLPTETDVLTCGPGPKALAGLVEDELLLAMPMVPMHPLNQCAAKEHMTGEAGGETARHPLAGLSQIKRDRE